MNSLDKFPGVMKNMGQFYQARILCLLLLVISIQVYITSAVKNEASPSFYVGAMPTITPEIHLEHFPYMTAIVKIYINETSLNKRDENFIIKAPVRHGVMAFIKQMNLRASSIGNDTVNEKFNMCTDFLQVKTSQTSPESHKVCIEALEKDRDLDPLTLVGARIFHDPSGTIDLSLHTENYATLPNNKTKLLAEIVFTAVSDCNGSTNGTATKRCSIGTQTSCISAELFCDGEIHCAFPDGFSSDERNCNESTVSTLIEQTNKKEADVRLDPQDPKDYPMNRYFIPTGLILFMIWGIITMMRKCYMCYKADKEKDEMYNY